MASNSKNPVVYACVLYGGITKGGYTFVDVSIKHPEAEIFEKMKPFFESGRYVKCQKSLDEVKTEIAEALLEHKYSDASDSIYKCNMEKVVKVLKTATGAKKASTMGVYTTKKTTKSKAETDGDTEAETEADTEAETEVVVKSVPKKSNSKKKPSEEEDAPAPVPKKKTTIKKTTPVSEDELEIEVKPTKRVSKKTNNSEEEVVPKKTVAKTKPVVKGTTLIELEDELDEVVVQTKGKTTGKSGSKTQVIIDSDIEQEEDN